jgi:integrase
LKFVESRRIQGSASKTISVDVKTLNIAFNLARKLGHIQSNPVEKALALHPIEVESSSKECFTPAQVVSLVKTADGDWKTVILLAYYTGARLGDCANMTWANVNLLEGTIDYVPQKTRKKNKRVVVPIHPELRARLLELKGGAGEEQLCPSLANRTSGGKSGLSEGFKRVMKDAGVDARTEQGQGKQQFSKLSFHSLRHSFNSALANNGIDQETRMKLTGHVSVATNQGYTHLGLPRLKQAIETLPALVPFPEPEKSVSAPTDNHERDDDAASGRAA